MTIRRLPLFALLSLAACGQQQGASTPPAATAYRVYVTNERSGDLTAIDGATRKVIGTYPLGKRPRGVRVSPDGKLLYIALSGSPIAGPGVDEDKLPPPDKSADGIGVFEVASNKLVRTITGVSDPEQLAVSADGKLYIASEDTGALVVMEIADGKIVAQVPVGREPEGVNLSPDGKTVWVTSEGDAQVTAVDTSTNKPLKSIKVGERPRNTAFSPDGKRAYVSGENDRVVKVIDTGSLTVSNTVKMPGEALRPMGVVTMDATALNVEGQVEVGGRPWGVGLSPDGKSVFTANGPTNDVSIVDATTMTVAAKVPAGKGPWGVAIVASP